MADYGFPTWPDRFTDDLISHIVAGVPGLTNDHVFLSVYTEDIHLEFPPADRFVTLFIPDFQVDAPGVSGGGIYTTGFESTLELNAYVRLEAGIEGRSAKLLNEYSIGIYDYIRRLYASVQTYPGLIDGTAGQSNLKRPMRIKNFRINRKTIGKQRWLAVPSNWEIAFVSDFGTNYTTL